ncbi:Fructose-bisphosphate aldolase 1 [Podila clonocystis]|nr:Fructose-bisphosphate aldolase 1 [Podila clonocystis]
MGLLDIVPAGVITGDNVRKVFAYASKHGFAIPAINCTSSSTVNAALEAARDAKSPIIIQFSQGGAAFYAGKGVANGNQEASILGAVAGALHVRTVAKAYGIPVIIHSDHCAKKLLPWFDGMLAADEEYFAKHGEPLFSSHMLDLSEESKEENIEICVKYLHRMAKINCHLEMEIGITGGEEDGVDNSDVDNASLYTQPQDILDIYNAFSKITDLFSIAAGFGNVHGVYAPGNVKLHPELLGPHQEGARPRDTQWAYWEGIKKFYESKKDYLQAQVGNPEGANKPNKKVYDPRVWVREAEKSMLTRVKVACKDLNNIDRL